MISGKGAADVPIENLRSHAGFIEELKSMGPKLRDHLKRKQDDADERPWTILG